MDRTLQWILSREELNRLPQSVSVDIRDFNLEWRLILICNDYLMCMREIHVHAEYRLPFEMIFTLSLHRSSLVLCRWSWEPDWMSNENARKKVPAKQDSRVTILRSVRNTGVLLYGLYIYKELGKVSRSWHVWWHFLLTVPLEWIWQFHQEILNESHDKKIM